MSAFINSSLTADFDTQEALRCAVKREGQWKNKSSTVVQCSNIMEELKAEEICFIPTASNCSTFEATLKIEKPKILKAGKAKVGQLFQRKTEEEEAKVPFQGELVRLMAEEESDISWRSLIYQVPRGSRGRLSGPALRLLPPLTTCRGGGQGGPPVCPGGLYCSLHPGSPAELLYAVAGPL